MKGYGLRVRRHYSGLLSAHCRDLPGLTIMRRDREEIELLAPAAIAAEIRRCEIAGEPIAEPRDSGHFRIGKHYAQDEAPAR